MNYQGDWLGCVAQVRVEKSALANRAREPIQDPVLKERLNEMKQNAELRVTLTLLRRRSSLEVMTFVMISSGTRPSVEIRLHAH